ncbi:hypothetical protein DY000_02033044 [Brassica cretica]|uniref:Uncharacterized protein n=1 Tax=Brassica cretica TaxID=69181 RepID=A0ABQ7DXQ3_BRACR|nr:hypothetical protein DY000_02033044 [Brassica cretica]
MPLLLLTYCTVAHHQNGPPFPSFRSVSLAGIAGFFGVLRIAYSSSTVDQFSTSGNFPTPSKSPQPP